MTTEDKRAIYKGKDVTGQIFGSYRVLEMTGVKVFPSGNSHHIWKVQCMSCGVKKESQSQHVVNGKYGCKACKGQAMSGRNSCHWSGGKYVPGYFVSKIKHAARRKSRNILFDLSHEYLDWLWESQGGRCAYTGWNLHFGNVKNPGTVSLDRIDSSGDYVEGNVQFVHKDVNIMKWELSDSRFREICSAIHQKGINNA